MNETSNNPTACQIAQLEHIQALRFVALWNYLLFAVGIVITGVLGVLLVWALFDQQWAAAAGAGAGGILELPLTLFLVNRRKEARNGLKEAREFVNTACGEADETMGGAAAYDVDSVENDFRLLGIL
ncbi:MAG TPA: hypothetical protein VFT19_03950 [Solirubrobacterales bacterium]|nr:hypothetical protein [Solirubrobacterales bacterium]